MADEWKLGKLGGEFAAIRLRPGMARQRFRLGTTDRNLARERMEAKRLELLAEEERTELPSATPAEVTLRELWKLYSEDPKNVGKPQVRTNGYHINLMTELADVAVSEIDEARCDAYVERRRAEGCSDNTIINALTYAATVLNWAEKSKRIDRAPHIWKPRRPDPRDRRLTKEEFARLVRSATMPHVRLALIIMGTTACRVTAALELTWGRVDFERGLINLRTGEERQRRMKGRAVTSMNATLRTALEEERQRQEADEFRPDYPAPIGNRATVVQYQHQPVKSIKTAFGTACDLAKLENVSPHVLRHSAACWMAEAGVSMAEIAACLGHKDSRITERVYAKFSPSFLRGATSATEIAL